MRLLGFGMKVGLQDTEAAVYLLTHFAKKFPHCKQVSMAFIVKQGSGLSLLAFGPELGDRLC